MTKQAYSKPELVKFGTVSALTKGFNGSLTDNVNAAGSKLGNG